jgi:Iap family predicted aminopeptidase
VEPLVDLALEESLGLSIDESIKTGLTEVYDRLEAIESRPDITMTAAERREAVAEAIQAVSTDREAHIESLRRNVHREAVAASLRSKVHG